jgi:methionine-rich copper-binding protein CopC
MFKNHRDGTRLRGLRTTVVALAAVTAWALATAQPAATHNVLIDTTPDKDSTVQSQPGTVELVFDQYVEDQFAQVAVLDAEESPFHTGEPTVEDNVVTQAVNDLPDGDYTVSYRVISADGHPVSGTFDFSVAAGTVPSADEPGPPAENDAVVGNTDDGVNGTAVTGLIVFAALAALALFTARNRRRLRRSAFFDDGAR